MSNISVKVSRETHKRLKTHGKMGESFDDVIERLIDFYEYHQP